MREDGGRRTLRRLTGGLAALGAMAAALGGAAGTARAEEPGYRVTLEAELGLPLPGSTLQQPWFHAALERPAGDTAAREYVLTYDFAEIASFVDVSVRAVDARFCSIAGTTMTCRHTVEGEIASVGVPELLAAQGSRNGQSGRLKVSAASEGITVEGSSTLVRVGGPDLAAVRVPLKDNPSVGEVQNPRYSFVNKGTLPAAGVLLALTGTRGLELPRTAGNCEYADLPGPEQTVFALCSFPGAYEPGATYRADRGIAVRTGTRAYVDRLSYRFVEDTPAERAKLRGTLSFTQGTGPAVVMEKTGASARSTDLYIWDNTGWWEPTARNTADFQAVGDTAAGAKGEHVTVDLGFRNNGPAWVTGTSGGDPRSVGAVEFLVPPGTRVTTVAEGCDGYSADRRKYYGSKPGAPLYVCGQGTFVLEDARADLPFVLLIEKDVENAEGRIKVTSTYYGGHGEHDKKPSNDSAAVVVNPVDEPGDGSGGSTAGGTSSGGSGGSDGGAAASGGASSGGSTGAAGGDLASTGSPVLPVALGAAAAVLAGGVLVTVVRRRRGTV
ncbi:hypothetical protein [Streptomyces sp. t39]|uniref:hypothetical protein n=1 Tax=Streptomyces sp. t39 TaxID=1828156 RepID=UPI00164F72D4|nr:hypothetical protein [Streptomyces sp. t39]